MADLMEECAEYERIADMLTGQRDRLQAEADRLKKVVKTQADSFRKLEAECAEWKRKCETMKKEEGN